MTPAAKRVLLNWEVGSNFGWGLLGLNIFFHWANDRDIVPFASETIGDDCVRMVDPLRLSVVSQAIMRSNDALDGLDRGNEQETIRWDGILIEPISHGIAPSNIHANLNVGRSIFENTDTSEFDRSLSKYDRILCGSDWNGDILRARTGRPVKVILEGIDPSLFCPGPKSGLLDPTKFYIFSGGKVEFRKAQDLVLLAFREFSTRHRDAVLVTAWHSPWPGISGGFQGRLEAPLRLDELGRIDIRRWVADNGIDPASVIELFAMPNQMMPTILREMDVAIQPSRAEACTNLPAKEAMACGVPVIIANNTGMKDLVTEDNCVSLVHQRPVPAGRGIGTEDWGESSVDEIVEALERVYVDRAWARSLGSTAARWIAANRTWKLHSEQLKRFLLGGE
jgi:glycosyltransferase involved in cell wall biosynthesis